MKLIFLLVFIAYLPKYVILIQCYECAIVTITDNPWEQYLHKLCTNFDGSRNFVKTCGNSTFCRKTIFRGAVGELKVGIERGCARQTFVFKNHTDNEWFDDYEVIKDAYEETCYVSTNAKRTVSVENCYCKDHEVDINKDSCDRIGGKGTFARLTRLQYNLPQCIEELSNDIPVNKINVAKTPIYHTSCLGQEVINECYQPIISTSKQCLNISENYLVDVWQTMDKDLVSYKCKNEDKIKKYFTELTQECMTNGIIKVQEKCLGLTGNPLSPIRDVSQVSCNKYEEAESCIMETLTDHCSQNIREVIITVIKILRTNTCNSSPKTLHRSERSLHRVVRQLAMTDKLERIENHLKTMCIKHGLEQKKMEDLVKKMKTCISEKPMFFVPKHIYIKHVDGCTKEVITLLKACLPEKYKYLPQLIFNIFDSMISFMYDDFALISSELSPCLAKLKGEESTNEYNECSRNVTDVVEDELVGSKAKFCERYIHLNQCFITQVKKQCTASKELTKFETDYMNAVKNPCE